MVGTLHHLEVAEAECRELGVGYHTSLCDAIGGMGWRVGGAKSCLTAIFTHHEELEGREIGRHD